MRKRKKKKKNLGEPFWGRVFMWTARRKRKNSIEVGWGRGERRR